MPLSTASVLHTASLALLLLLGAVASTAVNGDVNPMTSNATATPGDDEGTYICYLCAGRNPMLMRYCPIYWDECHLICYGPAASASVVPAAPAPPTTSPWSAEPGAVYGEECYVMKQYWNGSYVIVNTVNCNMAAWCLLTCGGGDGLPDREALGASTALPAATTALQGMLPWLRVVESERCSTQVRDSGAATTAVPGGGRRRR